MAGRGELGFPPKVSGKAQGKKCFFRKKLFLPSSSELYLIFILNDINSPEKIIMRLLSFLVFRHVVLYNIRIFTLLAITQDQPGQNTSALGQVGP